MTTGALAYDDLGRRDPAALTVVLHLMGSHPDRARFDHDLQGTPPGPERDRRLFELMARWPDDVRRTPFDHDDWHYSQKIVSALRWMIPPAFGGAEPAFRRELHIARDPGASAPDRAIALCWVFHIVGDMHEPLHAALWMDAHFPLTDQGGNTAWVRTAPDAAPQKLHWFWDSAARPGGSYRQSPTELEAQVASAHPDVLDPAPSDADVAGWVAHSRALAREDVYLRGALKAGVSPASAPVLSPQYLARARLVSTDQLALAGYRIGALIAGLR